MPSFPLLDIAIGLIFVYLLLSLICSSLNEGLESLLRNRAIDLETGIRKLLGDQPGSWWASFLPWINSIEKQTIAKVFYAHPLIRTLYLSEKKLPSYIPSRNFALAVMDLAVKDGTLLRGATNQPQQLGPGTVPFVDSVNQTALPDSLKNSIQALVTAANGETQQARLNIENWFNSAMDRVSGGYKARTQKILFCFGTAVTLAVNADSIAIFTNLSHNKNLQSIVGAAQVSAGQPAPSQDFETQLTQAMNQLSSVDIGLGWASEAQQGGHANPAKILPSFSGTGCVQQTEPCTNPFGWSLHLLYLHGIGWLVTAAALSLGAPFWFDMLNKFIVVRSTVKPKEKSQDEQSKDSAS